MFGGFLDTGGEFVGDTVVFDAAETEACRVCDDARDVDPRSKQHCN